jgi:hypothetical protein
MTNIKQRFEELFLDGHDRSNVMVSSQLQLGADGDYFNPYTKAMFKFYRLGLQDGIDKSVGVVLAVAEPEPEHTPFHEPFHDCDFKGPKVNGNETCSVCGFNWGDIPF